MTNVAFEALEKELRKCRVSFEHKDTELVETKDQLARAQELCANLQETNTLLEHSLEEQTAKVGQLEYRITTDNDGYKQAREMLEDEIIKLRSELELVKVQASLFEQDFLQERKDRENAHNMKEDIKLAFDQVVHAKEIECRGLTKRIEDLQTELTELVNSKQRNPEAIAINKEENEVLADEVKKLTQQLVESQEEIQTTKQQFSILEEENKSLSCEVEISQQRTDAAIKNADDLQKRILENVQELNSTIGIVTEQKVKLEKAEMIIEKLKQDNTAIKEIVENLTENNKALTLANSDLKNRLQQEPLASNVSLTSNHQIDRVSQSLSNHRMQINQPHNDRLENLSASCHSNPSLFVPNGLQNRSASYAQNKSPSCSEQEHVYSTFDHCFQRRVEPTHRSTVSHRSSQAEHNDWGTIPDVEPHEYENIMDEFEPKDVDKLNCLLCEEYGEEYTEDKSVDSPHYMNLPQTDDEGLYMNLPHCIGPSLR